VRIIAVLTATLTLAACHHGPSNEAIRQAVIDRLNQPGLGLNLAAMDVKVSDVQVNGTEADATVALTLKDSKDAPAMTMKYHLKQEGSKWVVSGLSGSGGSPHGGAMPPADGAHGGAASPDATGKMPSPQDLPPAGKGK
jgi:hypothetical protein